MNTIVNLLITLKKEFGKFNYASSKNHANEINHTDIVF